MRMICLWVLSLLLAALVAGCGGGEETATPQPTSDAPPAGATQPTIALTTEAPVEPGPEGAGTANPGDILFVRQGQLWAIGPDGSNERALTATAPDTVIDDLALSPSGFYLIFTMNSQELAYLEVHTGALMPVDTVSLGDISAPVWMPDSSAIYYQKVTLDPTTSLPARNAIMISAIPTEGGPGTVLESDLAANPAILVPRYALMGQVVVQDVNFAGNGASPWFVLDVVSQTLTPLAAGFTPVDLSPDGLRVLLLGSPDGGGAAPLFVADFAATGIGAPMQVSPEGEAASYGMPQFSPDGASVAAIRRDLAAPDQPATLVLFVPDGAGGFSMTPLAQPEGFDLIGFIWQSPGSLVLEGIPSGGMEADLWLVSTVAGGEATALTHGEFAVVVPAP